MYSFIKIKNPFFICSSVSSVFHDSRMRNAPSPTSRTISVQPEPAVDFELDIKVKVDSGECVLHPKEKEGDAEYKKYINFKNISRGFRN